MFYSSSGHGYSLIFVVIVVVGAYLYKLWRKYSLGRFVDNEPSGLADSPANSVILSYYTAGHSVINANRGKLDDMSYSLYATGPQDNRATGSVPYVEEDAAIYALDLPFNTESHFVGLSKQHKLNRLQFESFLKSSGMEKVVLEGDFPDYFDIYAAKDQQFEVRTVLNPEAMSFVVDYCQSHFWEINDSELYIVATSTDKSNSGNPSIIEESQQFVRQIKPALLPGEPGAPAVHHEVPYGEYDGPALPCPICQQTMTMSDAWQACPAGDGILINGRNLERLHRHDLKIPSLDAKDTPHKQLTCPNCHNPMITTNYEGSNIQIDSCEHCPFRWLDASDLALLAQ